MNQNYRGKIILKENGGFFDQDPKKKADAEAVASFNKAVKTAQPVEPFLSLVKTLHRELVGNKQLSDKGGIPAFYNEKNKMAGLKIELNGKILFIAEEPIMGKVYAALDTPENVLKMYDSDSSNEIRADVRAFIQSGRLPANESRLKRVFREAIARDMVELFGAPRKKTVQIPIRFV